MANTIDFNVSTNAVTVLNQTGAAAETTAKGFKSAKQELRALQNQLLEMDQTSEEFKKASKRAAELKDNISDLSAEINANAGNAFEGLSNNIGLFGSRLMNLDLKGAGTALTAMGVAVGRIDFKTVKEEVGGLVKGFANLAKAILSNPILLLAGVIAVVVMNMDKLRKAMPGLDAAMGGLTEKMKAAAKANEASLKAKQSEYDIIMASTAIMKAQGMNEKEILLAQQQKAKVLLEQKKVTDAQNIANAKADLQRNENLKMVLKGIQEVGLAIPKLMSFVFDAVFAKAKDLLSYVGITIDTSFSAYETIAGAQMLVLDAIFGNTQEEKQAIIDMEQQAALSQTQLANTIEQTNLDIKKSDDDLAKSKQKNLDKALSEQEKALEKQKEAEQKANEEIEALFAKWDEERIEEEEKKAEKEKEAAAQRLKEKQQELIDLQTIIDTADEGNYQATLSKQDQELIAQQDYYFNLISQAEAAGLDTAALIEEQGRKENEIKDKYRKEDEAKQQATQDFRLKQLGESFAALGALNDAFTKKGQQQSQKQFQIQKALNLASAVVDTYGGINRALNDKTMPSTTARIIQASIVGAMGLANVIKISKTEYGNASAPSGTNMSAGGGGDGGTTAPSPANFAFLQNQPNQQPPLQAYVVGTQVSSNLEAQQLIQNQSRLGG
jgi:hypothetical protein